MTAHSRPSWRCPLCNHSHSNPAATLARNFFAEQIVASFRAKSSQVRVRPIGEFGVCSFHQQDITLC